MSQSPELTRFYERYLSWINAGAPEGEPFSRTAGLCYSTRIRSGRREAIQLEREMSKQFKEAGLNSVHPFNSNIDSFLYESHHSMVHINPARIQWLKDHINVPE